MKYWDDFVSFVDSTIDSFSAPVYYLLIILLYIAYIFGVIGVTYVNSEYTDHLTNVLHGFIAVILFIRFNPLRRNFTCSYNDRILILASAFFLLFNKHIEKYITDHIEKYIFQYTLH